MKKSIGTQTCRTRRQAENREQFRKGCKFCNPCEISQSFLQFFYFCLILFWFLPILSLCNSILLCLVWEFVLFWVVYNAQATICKKSFLFSFIIEFLGKSLSNKLPFSFLSLIFSLAKHSLRMTTQRMSG